MNYEDHHLNVPHIDVPETSATLNDFPIKEIRKSLSELYPQYFKDVSDLDEIDVYWVHFLFQIDDYSGCIHHASKKLLLSGIRTGNKPKHKDIKEARDTLTRWLQINGHE